MSPFKVSDFARLGFHLLREFPEFQARQYWSTDRIQSFQCNRLRKRLKEAKAKVPLYRDLQLPDPEEIRTLEDWSKLPIVRKADLLARPERDRLHADFSSRDLLVSRSSGSTGQALDVFYDRESFCLFALAVLRMYSMIFRYLPWHRQTYVYTSPYPFNSFFGAYPLRFIPTLAPIPQLIEDMRRAPPHLLVCYPSHLRAVTEQMSESDFACIRPVAINVNSEMSCASERHALSERWGAIVFDDYSSEELTQIASQCRHLAYHLFEDINYLEIVDDEGRPVPEGEVGNLVGSNLHNRGMPLLRYWQGDRAAIRTSRCECGRKFRLLERLEGRKNDEFVLSGGQRFTSGFLLDLTYAMILRHPGAVQSFCLIQEAEPEVWVLEVVPGRGWHEALSARICDELSQEIRNSSVRLSVRLVEQVTRTPSGKANPIFSRCKRNLGRP